MTRIRLCKTQTTFSLEMGRSLRTSDIPNSPQGVSRARVGFVFTPAMAGEQRTGDNAVPLGS